MAASPEELWQRLAAAYAAAPDVTSGTGFGRSQGLRVSGRIFAMLVDGELVVKLPRARVDELIESGVGGRFDPGHGRVLREWASVPTASSRRWRALVAEAHAFVGAKG